MSTRGPVDLWVAGFAWVVGCGQNISHAGRVRCRPMDPWNCGPVDLAYGQFMYVAIGVDRSKITALR